VLGKEHPDTLASVHNLAALYQAQGRYSEAEPLYKRALEAYERVLGKGHPDTLASVNNLAALYYAQHDWVRAAQFWRRSTAVIAGRTQRGATGTGQAVTGKKKSEAEQLSWQFWGLVKVVYRLAPEGRAPDAKPAREMFQTAQWAQNSEAAASLAQMAARGATGDLKLAALARERQDLVAEWQKRDGLRNSWLGKPSDKRDAKAEAENSARLAAIDTRIAEIDKELVAKFPDYAALASPAPLAVEEVQAQLRPNEALVLFLDTAEWKPTPEETFVWVVTKTDVRWVRSGLGTPALTREVEALRCGLDAEAWSAGGAGKCAGLLGIPLDNAPKDGDLLPFDLGHAHALYKALFGGAEDLIKGKSLIIVPGSGPAHPIAAPGARVSAAGERRLQVRCVAGPRTCADRFARRVLAKGAAPGGAAERCEEADDRLRQSPARRRSGRSKIWRVFQKARGARPREPKLPGDACANAHAAPGLPVRLTPRRRPDGGSRSRRC